MSNKSDLELVYVQNDLAFTKESLELLKRTVARLQQTVIDQSACILTLKEELRMLKIENEQRDKEPTVPETAPAINIQTHMELMELITVALDTPIYPV
jgi:hypothetical protein